jgi:predicted esterase
VADYLLLETGDRLLQENGDGILLETSGGVSGTVAVTLGAATSAASGTVANPVQLTDRGTVNTTAGTSTSNTTVSSAWTPAAGSVVAVLVRGFLNNTSLAYSASDSFGDTGGTSWTQVTNIATGSGYGGRASLFYRTIGTTPSSGTVTITRTPTGSIDQWMVSTHVELTHTDGTPTFVGSQTAQNATASMALTLGATPANTSAVLTAVVSLADTSLTTPTSFTLLNHTVGASSAGAAAWALGSVGSPTWTGLGTFANAGVAAEFSAPAVTKTWCLVTLHGAGNSTTVYGSDDAHPAGTLYDTRPVQGPVDLGGGTYDWSPDWFDPVTFPNWSTIEALLETAADGYEKVAVAGFSAGGAVAIQMLIEGFDFDGRLVGVILDDPAGPVDAATYANPNDVPVHLYMTSTDSGTTWNQDIGMEALGVFDHLEKLVALVGASPTLNPHSTTHAPMMDGQADYDETADEDWWNTVWGSAAATLGAATATASGALVIAGTAAPTLAAATATASGNVGATLPDLHTWNVGLTLYVDAVNGTDHAGTSTSGSPWQTLQHAHNRLRFNETWPTNQDIRIVVRPGTYQRNAQTYTLDTFFDQTGKKPTATQRVIWDFEDGAVCKLPSGTSPTTAKGFARLDTTGSGVSSYQIFNNIHIDGEQTRTNVTATSVGLFYSNNTSFVEVIGGSIHGIYAMDTDDGSPTSLAEGIQGGRPATDHIVWGCHIYDIGTLTGTIAIQEHAIYLQGDRCAVINNLIGDIPNGYGIQFYDGGQTIDGSMAVGNTVYNCGQSCIVVPGHGTNITIKNNILVEGKGDAGSSAGYGVEFDPTGDGSGANNVIDSNVFYLHADGNVETAPAGWTITNSHSGDPLFTNYAARDLTLTPSSPAVGFADAAWVATLDIDGIPRDSDPDAGAYELYVSGTAAPTLGAATASASGTVDVSVTGTAAVTLAAATAAASGALVLTGTAAPTLAAATSTASGTFTPPTVTGTAAATLAAATSSASGAFYQPISALVDDFTGTEIDENKWVVNGDSTTQNGTLVLPCEASYAEFVTTVDRYAASDDTVFFEVVDVPTGATSEAYIELRYDSSNLLYFGVRDRSFRLTITTGGSDSNFTSLATWNGTNHRWWRIRVEGGDLFCEVAPASSGSWTTLTTQTAPAWLVNPVGVVLWTGHGGGGSGNFEVDNVNFAGAVVGTAAVTLEAATSTAAGTATPPTVTGTAAATLAAATSSASGTVGVPTYTGSAAITLGAATAEAEGTVEVTGIAGTAACQLQAATCVATGTRTRHFFEVTPTEVREALAESELRAQGLHSRWARRFGVYRAFTVLKLDGTYVQVTNPTSAQLSAATETYLGGHRHPIDGPTATALTNAGFGAYVTVASE